LAVKIPFSERHTDSLVLPTWGDFAGKLVLHSARRAHHRLIFNQIVDHSGAVKEFEFVHDITSTYNHPGLGKKSVSTDD
jgi:hypothetical protein